MFEDEYIAEEEEIVAEEEIPTIASIAKIETVPTAKSSEGVVTGFCRPCGKQLRAVPILNGKVRCSNCNAEYKW